MESIVSLASKKAAHGIAANIHGVERVVAPEKQFELVTLKIESDNMRPLVISNDGYRPAHSLLG